MAFLKNNFKRPAVEVQNIIEFHKFERSVMKSDLYAFRDMVLWILISD